MIYEFNSRVRLQRTQCSGGADIVSFPFKPLALMRNPRLRLTYDTKTVRMPVLFSWSTRAYNVAVTARPSLLEERRVISIGAYLRKHDRKSEWLIREREVHSARVRTSIRRLRGKRRVDNIVLLSFPAEFRLEYLKLQDRRFDRVTDWWND